MQENIIQLFEGGRQNQCKEKENLYQDTLPRTLHEHLSVHTHVTHTTFFRRQNRVGKPGENKDLDGLAQHATMMVENLPFHCILFQRLEFYHIHILPTHTINFLNKLQLVNRAKNHQIL